MIGARWLEFNETRCELLTLTKFLDHLSKPRFPRPLFRIADRTIRGSPVHVHSEEVDLTSTRSRSGHGPRLASRRPLVSRMRAEFKAAGTVGCRSLQVAATPIVAISALSVVGIPVGCGSCSGLRDMLEGFSRFVYLRQL